MASELLRPLKSEPQKPRNIVTFDLESKKRDSQKAGFERPFLVGVYDSRKKSYSGFFDDRNLDKDDTERAFKPGGCIDKFFQWLTDTSAGRKLQSANKEGEAGSILYAHNGGAFDTLHLVRWLRRPENANRFKVRMIAAGPQLIELRIQPLRPVRKYKLKKGRKKGKTQKANQKGWIIRDSMRLAAGSLDEAARRLALDVQKTRMPAQLGGLDADETHHDAWRDYNRPDCEVAAGVVRKFQDILQKLGGQLCMTLPASTMDLFRRRFLPAFLKSAHLEGCPGDSRCPDRAFGGCNFMRDKPGLPRERHFPGCPSICPECRRQEVCMRGCSRRKLKRRTCPADPYGCLHAWLTIAPTAARHGGRTEVFCFKDVVGKLRYYDRNSSYAAAMLEPMPIKMHSHDADPEGDPFAYCERKAAQGLVGFIECSVFIPDSCDIPPLPIVYNDKLVFPVGVFHGRWDWTELRHIKDVGGEILCIDRAVWYRAAPVLAPMMRTLYRMRLNAAAKGDKALSSICKDLMNALYGKFIMSPERKNIVATTEEDAPMNAVPLVGEQAINEPLGSTLLYGLPVHNEAPYFLPHIGAHITALARECLWLKMQEITKLGGRIYYVDTDAVVFDGPLLPSSSRLGEWKRVHAKVKRLAGHFDSPKSYALTSLSGEPLDDVHEDACMARRRAGEESAYACKGCATSGVHIKGLHRSHHTIENFEKFLSGDTIDVEDQTPKLGQLLACDFKEYVTLTRRLSSHAQRPKNDRDKTVFVDKRVRIGDETHPVYMSTSMPWVHVEDGKFRRSTLGEHFDWLKKQRKRRLKKRAVLLAARHHRTRSQRAARAA